MHWAGPLESRVDPADGVWLAVARSTPSRIPVGHPDGVLLVIGDTTLLEGFFLGWIGTIGRVDGEPVVQGGGPRATAANG